MKVRASSGVRLLPLFALLLADLLCLGFGAWVWSYRFHVHLQDPTSYHLNSDVTFMIVAPALLALLLILVRLVQLHQAGRSTQAIRRKLTDPFQQEE